MDTLREATARARIEWLIFRTKAPDRLAAAIANRLPRRVVYWATIRVGVHATTGPWSDCEVPGVTLPEILTRWEHRHGRALDHAEG